MKVLVRLVESGLQNEGGRSVVCVKDSQAVLRDVEKRDV